MSNQVISVEIQRYKGIQSAVFDTSSINVLIGANNAGKSTVAQLLHFGIGLLQAIGLERRWGQQDTVALSLSPSQLLYSPCADLYSLGHGGQLAEDKDKSIQLSLVLESGEKVKIEIRRGRNGNIHVQVENRIAAMSLAELEKPYTIYSPGLAGISREESLISNGVLLRTIARGDANLVLRNILYRLHKDAHEKGWSDFIDDLRQLFDGIKIFVSFDVNTDEHILIEVDTSAGRVPIELAGTGVLQAVQILSYVHFFHPSAIILDEPDSHLHPNNQRLLCKLLQRVAEERSTQIFLTTHSRHVVDALSGQSNFLWVRSGTVEKMEKDHDVAVLLDIGALDVKEMLSRSSAKAIVLTEDELKRNLEVLLESSGFPMNDTLTLAYYGCTSPHNLRPLIELIKGSNSAAKIVVHRDRDYLNTDESESWCKTIRAMGAEPFLTLGVDVESHFLNADYLASINGVSKDEMNQLIDAATDECSGFSIEKYVNGRSDISKKNGEFGKVNIGKLATEGPKLLAENPERFRHSKTVLKTLRTKFRDKNQINLKATSVSDVLSDSTLNTISKKL